MAASGSCTPPSSLDAPLPGFPKEILQSEPPDKYLCSECEDLLRRPYQAQCGHRYCAYCLKKLVGSGPLPCAACLREGLYEEGVSVLDGGTAYPDNAARREVESLPAACARKDCPWKGTVKEYEAHEETCPKFPMTCAGCGKTDVPRGSFADHVRSCGRFRAPCRFGPVGCGEVLEKQALPLHEAQNLPEHLGLLLTFALRLGAQDPHLFGAPDSEKDPSLLGAPHPAKDPNLLGAPNSEKDPHLLGAPHPAKDPNLLGAPNSEKDPNLLGAPHPAKDPHLFGAPDLVQDPHLVQEPHLFGAPRSEKDPHLFGAPDLVQEPHLSRAPNLAPDPHLFGAPHLAKDPHLVGGPNPAPDPHWAGAPHLLPDPRLSGAPEVAKGAPNLAREPHSTPDPHLLRGPHWSQDPHLSGAPNSAKGPRSPPDPHFLGAPKSAQDPHLLGAPNSAPDPHPTRGPNSAPDPHFLGGPNSAQDPHPTRGPNSAPDPHFLGGPHSAPDPHPTRGPHSAPDPHVLGAPDPHALGAPQWGALELKAATLEKIVCVLNREVERLGAESAQERRREEERAEALTHKIRTLERNLALKDAALAEVESALRRAEDATYDGVLIWKVEEVGRKRQEAVAGRAPAVFSPAFYTGRYGYKMCLRLYLNGDGSGRNTHLSLFFVLMKGPNDALLKWPFNQKDIKPQSGVTLEPQTGLKGPNDALLKWPFNQKDIKPQSEVTLEPQTGLKGPNDALLKLPFNQKVTLMLLDQDHREHVIDAFRPDVTSSSFQRPIGELNVASGCPLFCPLSKMAARDSYVRDDTLFIKAIVDLTGL